MGRFIGRVTANVELFSNIFTSGIETFVIPWDQHLYPCVVEVCRLRLESLCDILCQSENSDADRTGISSGVRKYGPQLSMLTPCALLCVLVSAALAPTWRTIIWTSAPWQFCVTGSGKSAGNDLRHSWQWISIGSMLRAFKTISQSAFHSRRDQESERPSSTAATMLLWEVG